MLLRRKIKGAEVVGYPMEERIIRLQVVPAAFQGGIIELCADQLEVEYIEERIGNRRISAARKGFTAPVRATRIGVPLLPDTSNQIKHGLGIDDECILIDIYGDIALLIGKHGIEISVRGSVRQPDHGESQGFVETLGAGIKLQVK